MADHKIQTWQLNQRQALDLPVKIERSKARIREFYKHFDGMIYVAFSGGKDSTVLLDLVRSIYPDAPAIFVDTGLEYPEIREFVKTFDNVEWLRPTKTFPEVIETEGYPVISKLISMAVDRYHRTDDPVQKELRLWGGKNPSSGKMQRLGVIPKKYHYLIDAPFKISDQCCYWLKKKPVRQYESRSKRKPFVGMMATDSLNRRMMYLRNGCNSFDGNKIQSNPLGFWTEEDIWGYIKKCDLPYSKIYDMGYDRTGCMFCMFGIHMEQKPNRFQRMSKTHPKQYKFCMEKLNMKMVLDFIHVDYEPSITLESFGEV